MESLGQSFFFVSRWPAIPFCDVAILRFFQVAIFSSLADPWVGAQAMPLRLIPRTYGQLYERNRSNVSRVFGCSFSGQTILASSGICFIRVRAKKRKRKRKEERNWPSLVLHSFRERRCVRLSAFTSALAWSCHYRRNRVMKMFGPLRASLSSSIFVDNMCCVIVVAKAWRSMCSFVLTPPASSVCCSWFLWCHTGVERLLLGTNWLKQSSGNDINYMQLRQLRAGSNFVVIFHYFFVSCDICKNSWVHPVRLLIRLHSVL